jgi:ATP-dependent HslUV protease subunit HslV
MKHSDLNARQIVEEALKIAAEICVYTNTSIHVEEVK